MNSWLKYLIVTQLLDVIAQICCRVQYDNNTCFIQFGCVNYTEEWFDNKLRPKNLPPLDRHVINTKFLFLSMSPEQNVIVYDAISANPLTINITSYAKYNNLALLIHDFTSNGYTGWVKHMAAKLFYYEMYNVVAVDWQEGAEPPFDQAISNARVVAIEIEQFLYTLKNEYGLPYAKIHIIGHGVGAHIAGYVGKAIPDIARITGLDPTGPRFEQMPAAVRLDSGDALYVEVLHTDTKGSYRQGTPQPLGHMDFYFNNGTQPGCKVNKTYGKLLKLTRNDMNEGAILPDCAHKRAFHYYLEAISVDNDCRFFAVPVGQQGNAKRDGCTISRNRPVTCATIGLHVDIENYSKANHEKFEIDIHKYRPYCINVYEISVEFAKCKEAEDETTGYFNFLAANEFNSVVVNITFNHPKNGSVPIHLGTTSVYPFYNHTLFDVDEIKFIALKWHLHSAKNCHHCKNATCIQSLSILHVTSIRSVSETPLLSTFCPKKSKYVVIHDKSTCDNFMVGFQHPSSIVWQINGLVHTGGLPRLGFVHRPLGFQATN